MSQFDHAYFTFVEPIEGFYANVPGDKGKETYRGMSRANYPLHPIWPVIDAYKKTLGRTLRNNEKIPPAEPYVVPFYKDWWNRLNLSAINSQEIADVVYDFIVNSNSTGTLYTEQVLHDIFGANIKADRTFDAATIALINAQDPAKLQNAILEKRKGLYAYLRDQVTYYKVVAGDTVATISSKTGEKAADISRWNNGRSTFTVGESIKLFRQEKFYAGWMKRLEKFPVLKVAAGAAGLILLAVGLFFLSRKRKRNKT